MISTASGLALIKTAVELWKGKERIAYEGTGETIRAATKGLKGSRTAKTAAGMLAVKVGFALALPLPTWLQYAIVGAFFAEFIVNLFLRVITRGPV